MSDEYWDGATWVYDVLIQNGAGGSGTQSAQISPGAGNELEVLYGQSENLDTSARVHNVRIRDDAGNFLIHLESDTVAAGLPIGIPKSVVPGDVEGTPHRMMVSGDMDVFFESLLVAASQDSHFSLVARVRGGVPTVTEVGQSTPTITINTERVF